MTNDYTFSLENDYRHCQSLIRQHSKSFYYAFSSLPEPDANAVYAIYAFCRIADDAIDQAEDMKARSPISEDSRRSLMHLLQETPPRLQCGVHSRM